MRRWYAQRNGTDAVGRLQERLGRSMLHADPPDHTRLRKPVSKAFTARQVNGLRPRIEEIADELLGVALAVGPTMDVITALAYPLSITVICELSRRPAQRPSTHQGVVPATREPVRGGPYRGDHPAHRASCGGVRRLPDEPGP
jgi:cytochrome P450